MKLSEVAIERPVLATVMSLLILLFGAISLGRLPNRELPDIDPPIVSVTTVLPGASPEVVETSITQVLEDQLIAIEGIRHLTSESREQVSSISIEFDLGRDVDLAAADVRDRVGRVRARLPDEATDPTVAKSDADSSPVLWLSISGEADDQIALTRIAEDQVIDRLAKLPGVSDVILAGEKRYSIRIWIDNARLTAHDLTIADIERVLASENVERPSGRIEGPGRELTVRTLGEMQSPEAFAALVIANRAGGPVRIGDVATVEVGPADDRKIVRFQGKPSVALGVVRQSKANTLDVVDAVREEIAALGPDLPSGVRIDAAFDGSRFIRRAIRDVATTIVEAVVLVVIVIFLFLRSLRATIIPVLAIPVSIVGTFSALDAFGYSLNTLTLMGLTLAIGLVVDDAIVVLENVSRWIEEGTPRREAAHRGMQEISFAVLAATASVIAVFLPLTFLTDTTGRLFREFGTTVAVAVAISGFVALTLTPMLCARVLREDREESGIARGLGSAIDAIARGYGALLAPSLRHPGPVALCGLAWFALGGWLLTSIDREFVPSADRGAVLAFTRAPEGATIDYTAKHQELAERALLAVPEMANVFSVVGLGIGTPGAVNEGGVFAMLKPWEERERSQQEIVAELQGAFWAIPGLLAFPINPPPLGQNLFSSPVQIVIQGPKVEELARLASEVERGLRGVPGIVNPRSDLRLEKPQLVVEIDRERAADLGVSVQTVARTLQVLLGGTDLTNFKLEGETYDVIAQLRQSERSRPSDILGLYVRAANGALVPLVSLATVREGVAARTLPHFDRQRSATVSAGLAPGMPLGTALTAAQRVVDDLLPSGRGYRSTFSGQSEQFGDSSRALAFAYLLAVAIVYLVLAAQFESFLHPLTVLVAVALSFTGALITLIAVGDTLNLFSQIGLVLLVGLVTKNSILIVEFAEQLREAGRSALDAASEAARLRFRPILMTALSTTFGILPIALGLGAGGESRAPLGVAVAGGMAFSTALTIFVVPAVYLLVDRIRDRTTAS